MKVINNVLINIMRYRCDIEAQAPIWHRARGGGAILGKKLVVGLPLGHKKLNHVPDSKIIILQPCSKMLSLGSLLQLLHTIPKTFCFPFVNAYINLDYQSSSWTPEK